MESDLSFKRPDPRLFLVGMGPGPVEDLTLKTWQLLASGDPVRASTTEHEVVQTLMARGFSVEVFDVERDGVGSLVQWAESRGTVIYAVPGTPMEIGSLAAIIDEAADRVEVEIVPALTELDRLPASDPITGGFALGPSVRGARAFARLVAIMARLRAPGGCPWDAEQTHESLAIHLLEEAHEALDAIDRGDFDHLEEELGDLLLQIVFHAEIAAESHRFEIADVVEELSAKLVHRHPHVFSNTQVSSAGEVVANWEALKSHQKGRVSLDEGIPQSLPALLLAHKVQRRLSGAGRTHDPSPDRLLDACRRLGDKVDPAAVGDALFEVVAFALAGGVDPEGALRARSKRALDEANSGEKVKRS